MLIQSLVAGGGYKQPGSMMSAQPPGGPRPPGMQGLPDQFADMRLNPPHGPPPMGPPQPHQMVSLSVTYIFISVTLDQTLMDSSNMLLYYF